MSPQTARLAYRPSKFLRRCCRRSTKRSERTPHISHYKAQITHLSHSANLHDTLAIGHIGCPPSFIIVSVFIRNPPWMLHISTKYTYHITPHCTPYINTSTHQH